MRYPRFTPASALASALTALLALAPDRAPGQIVLDGTTGAAGPLTGPNFTISDTFGTRVGSNLFHSFSDFNVKTSETATFVSGFTGTTQNIISRVTGPGASLINGRVASTVPGASLWLVNPNGVVLGAGASLDVQGSFYASTADALLLQGGGRFDASNPAGSTLTVGNPVAFGFLDATMGSIAVSGTTLAVPAGRTLALVGGTIDAANATLSAPAGHVVLASAAGAGNIAAQPGAAVASPVAQHGTIALNAATIATTAGGGGGGAGGGGTGGGGAGGGGGAAGAVTPDVYILGGQFMMRSASRIATNTSTTATATGDVQISVAEAALLGGSQIRTGTSGATRGGRVTFAATGQLRIEGSSQPSGGGGGGGGGGGAGGSNSATSTASGIFSQATAGATARGGSIELTAPQLRLANGAEVSSSTLGAGTAGDIALRATSRLTVTQESQVSGSTSGSGAGGNILLDAPIVEALNGARIGSTAQSTGAGGDITIVAPEAFIATGTNGVADPANNRGTRITTASFFTSTGDAGSISVQAGRVELADGARMSTSTSGIGDGGAVTVAATGAVTLRGARADGSGSAIKTSTEVEADEIGAIDEPRLGNAGSVTIEAASLALDDGAEVVGNTALLGAGGSVTIDVETLHVANARIASESTAVGGGAGSAGEIAIDARNVELANAARISASTIDGTGGAVNVNAAAIRVAGGSAISAATTGAGAGGDVVLAAETIDLTNGGTVTASSAQTGKAGTLRLTAADALTLDSSSLRTSAPGSAGGDIVIVAGRTVKLTDSTVSAEAGGVTPADAGGNVTIDPDYVIMNRGDVIARANAGNGGNITISAGFFVASAESAIDASSSRGLDGRILIDSPNQITGSVLPLAPPAPVTPGLLAQNCVPRLARQRSTLTVQSRGAELGPMDYLPSPVPIAADPSPATAVAEHFALPQLLAARPMAGCAADR